MALCSNQTSTPHRGTSLDDSIYLAPLKEETDNISVTILVQLNSTYSRILIVWL
jgi:hypothetical protein